MLQLISKWFVTALAFLLTTYFLKGVHSDSILVICLAAAVFGVINAAIRPIIVLITLPITVLSLGFFTFFINGFLLWMTAKLVSGFHVDSFWWGFWGAILISVFSSIISSFLPKKVKQQQSSFGNFNIHINKISNNPQHPKKQVEDADFEVIE